MKQNAKSLIAKKQMMGNFLYVYIEKKEEIKTGKIFFCPAQTSLGYKKGDYFFANLIQH